MRRWLTGMARRLRARLAILPSGCPDCANDESGECDECHLDRIEHSAW